MPVRKLFLSVGAMKAATTFLFNAFSRHPDLYFTPEKELHFFAQVDGLSTELRMPIAGRGFSKLKARIFRQGEILSPEFRRHRLSSVMHNRFSRLQDADQLREIVRWYADRYLTNPVDDDWFERVFAAAGDRYACEFSNYNALLGSNGWQHARSLCDELRVMYTLRHPVTRMWSHIKFNHIQSGRRASLDNFSMNDLEDILCEGAISAHSRYGDIVEAMLQNLDRSQLKIVVFENFSQDYTKGLADVENFLGISAHVYRGIDFNRKSNSTEDIPLQGNIAARIMEACLPQLEKLKRLGVELPASYYELP